MSFGRLQRLIRKLPRDSATALSVQGEGALWGSTEHLLAGVLDSLAAANWQRGGGKGSKPKPVTRPGDGSGRRKTTLTQREIGLRLVRQQERG